MIKRKISTKIIILSLINSIVLILIIAVSTVLSSGNFHGGSFTNAFELPSNKELIGLMSAMIFGGITSYLFGQYISKPLTNISELVNRTAKLDLTENETYQYMNKYNDEFGDIATSLNYNRKALTEMVIILKEIALSVNSNAEVLNNYGDENIETIARVVHNIEAISEQSRSQSVALDEINGIMISIKNSVFKVSKQADNSAENASNSMQTIEYGQREISEQNNILDETFTLAELTGKSINDLNKGINNVADIVNVITAIADQTNLLAIDAAIEAARGDVDGKGFAVIAEEIRKLADNSSKSAKEIVKIIDNIVVLSGSTVENINKVNEYAREQKKAMKVTQLAFENIKDTNSELVKEFVETAKDMQRVNELTVCATNKTYDIAELVKASVMSTEKLSDAGHEQANLVNNMALSLINMESLAKELQNEITKFTVDH